MILRSNNYSCYYKN